MSLELSGRQATFTYSDMDTRWDSLIRATSLAIISLSVEKCQTGFKDRQQEVWPVLAASQYNGNHYVLLEVQYMYYIYIISLLYDLFINIMHI